MPLTVDAAFTTFFEAINLAGDHRGSANARKDRIVNLLEKKLEVVDAFSTGSIPKFTALRQAADLDVMVVLHYGKHVEGRSPTQLLATVREALADYTTSVRRNGQAVTLRFQTWPSVDIVPVAKNVTNGILNYYIVPDATRGGWIPSRPWALSTAIEAKATECGPNFRRVVKMVKHWNSRNGELLSSYHIEVLALTILEGHSDDLPWDLVRLFDKSRTLMAQPLWYDLGYADDYLGANDRILAARKLEAAAKLCSQAWLCTYGGRNDHRGAIALWRTLFGERFPTYG